MSVGRWRPSLAGPLLAMAVAACAGVAPMAPTERPPSASSEAGARAPERATDLDARDVDLRPTGPTERAIVVHVADGDTVRVLLEGREQRLRYIGIDTPESVHPERTVEPWAIEASEANVDLVGGREVVLERDVSEADQYGRLLRYVWLEPAGGAATWRMVNLELLRAGLAQVTTYPPDVKYVELFTSAQREAREAGRGLWSSE